MANVYYFFPIPYLTWFDKFLREQFNADKPFVVSLLKREYHGNVWDNFTNLVV